ncbi:MAG TPA: M90 family metallopeptidase [Burkholderiales bacterium]|nr:M90 family metallopeptidase [Burkholderiales bacterium]
MGWFRSWRRARILQQATLEPGLWRSTVARYPFTRVLSEDDLRRLRELTILFLHDKGIHGAAGMAVRDEVRAAIAVQACMLILNLGAEYYRGWVEVIVYPDEFVAEYEFVDEAGVAHRVEEPMTGESWQRGPVILSWADAQEAGRGSAYNVVIHEFAHKLDMLNGEPNGFPPLHADMSRARWSGAFSAAYEDFCRKIDSGIESEIDEYAAESPAEFFAVMSEVFFESPVAASAAYPDVYAQLAQFYRQDPGARLAAGRASADETSTHA